MSEEFTFFWNGPFSQWHESDFEIDGIKFVTAEQFMMHQKAVLFEDEPMATMILATKDPRQQKAFGRKVRNFDAEIWSARAKEVVKEGNIAKFTQNPGLLAELEATKGTTLVEASPYDKIWGIGLGEWQEERLSRDTWQGTNWLGEVLTEVRIELCGE